jgi:hypothetical protein
MTTLLEAGPHIAAFVRRCSGLLCVAIVVTACTTLGALEDRAAQINVKSANYSASAIFYNVLRATFAEPLNFVSLTAVTGHGTASASIGLPTITFGTPAQKLYSFGPNSISGSEADDFNISIIDDPASFAALARPIDPATVGFFINQFFNRDQLLFLAIAKIDVTDLRGSTTTYYNEPWSGDVTLGRYGLDLERFPDFYQLLQWYLHLGLTVVVDQGYVPQPNKTGTAVFCFNPKLPGNPDLSPSNKFAISSRVTTYRGSCPTQEAMNASPVPKEKQPTSEIKKGNATTINIQVNAQSSPSNESVPIWSFDDPLGARAHIYLRSVFGMYRYLGELVNLHEAGALKSLKDYPGGVFSGGSEFEMLALTHDALGCWASVTYHGRFWCVPEVALQTKRTFQILQQLFKFYASPSNQTVTPTVRTTP